MQWKVSGILRAVAARTHLLPAAGTGYAERGLPVISCPGTAAGPAAQPLTGSFSVNPEIPPASGPQVAVPAGQIPLTHRGGARA